MLSIYESGVPPLDDRFLQQLKKGILEMLVLQLICDRPTYGYELLSRLREQSDGLFALKEGTLYPILYRLEDDGLIRAGWSTGQGRSTPKKIYTATAAGEAENLRRLALWRQFSRTVSTFTEEEPL